MKKTNEKARIGKIVGMGERLRRRLGNAVVGGLILGGMTWSGGMIPEGGAEEAGGLNAPTTLAQSSYTGGHESKKGYWDADEAAAARRENEAANKRGMDYGQAKKREEARGNRPTGTVLDYPYNTIKRLGEKVLP